MHAIDPLTGTWSLFANPPASRFHERVTALATWIDARTRLGLMPYDRRLLGAPVPWTTVRERDGSVHEGLNFATSDYLGLASHPKVKQAAQAAIARFGTHGAGTGAQAGIIDLADELTTGLGRLLHMRPVALQPSGWTAAYGAVRAMVRAGDTVLLDAHTDGGLSEGALAATKNVHRFRHLDVDHARRWLKRLRACDSHRAVLVASPSVFPADGGVADLFSLHSICREFDALLLVDVAHDLGCVGPNGTGEAGLQGMEGRLDVVVGSLSKTFGSNGGFIATQRMETRDYLRAFSPPHAFSSAPGPAQIAAAHAAVEIVRSPEGVGRRAALHRAALALRAGLARHRLTLCGSPGPLVQIDVGCEAVGRTAVRLCTKRGILLNLLEHPSVPRGTSRLRLHLMAGHEPALLADVATKIANAISEAERVCASRNSPTANSA